MFEKSIEIKCKEESNNVDVDLFVADAGYSVSIGQGYHAVCGLDKKAVQDLVNALQEVLETIEERGL